MSNVVAETKKIKTKKVVPDGNYGWFVVGAYSLFYFIASGMFANFGVLFKEKISELQLAATDVAIIQTAGSSFGAVVSLLSAPLINRFGCRTMAIATAVFFSSGFMLSGMANSFTTFLLAYSIIVSIGSSFGFPSFLISMLSYFDVHRNKASGMAMTIAAIGPIVYPPMIAVLLKFYDVEGCIWILCAICLNLFVAAFLLQPVKWHMKQIEISDIEMSPRNVEKESQSIKCNADSIENGKETEICNEIIPHHLSNSDVGKVQKNDEQLHSVTETNSNKAKGNIIRRCCNWLVDTLDLTLLKDGKFVTTLIAISLSDFGEINFSMITPMVLQDHKFDPVQVASIMSAIAIIDIIFRFLSPFIGNFLRQSPTHIYIYGLIVFFCARLAIQLSTGYGWAIFGGVVLGIGRGIVMVYWNVIFPNCVPIERLPCAMGILMITNGLVVSSTGPIVGLLRDRTGNYTSSIYLINFTTVLSICVFIYLIRNDKKAAKSDRK